MNITNTDTNTAPLVSVIMSVHNGGKYLEEAIDSVLYQTYKNFEFIIANDASTDNTLDVLNKYKTQDSRIKIVNFTENKGLVGALNELLAHINGEFTARMDADDVSLPNRFACQVAEFIANDDLVLLGTLFDYIDGSGLQFAKGRPPHNNDALQKYLMNEGNPFCHPSVMMRTRHVKALGGYRQIVNRYAQDYDLFLRLSELGTVANIPDVLMHYRIHEGQITVQKMLPQLRSAFVYQELAKDRRAGLPENMDEAIRRADARKKDLKHAVIKGASYWGGLMMRQGNRIAARTLFWSALKAHPANYRVIRSYLSCFLPRRRSRFL
ncbi:MAG: glycosyltransferase [Pseudomonadota bacterium]